MSIRRTAAVTLLLALAGTTAFAATVDVTVGPGLSFSPANVDIQVGDTVRWSNAGGIHNVAADDGSFSSGPIAGGSWTFSRTFGSAGTFGYFCEAHGGPGGLGMSGTVTVAGGGGTAGSLRFSAASYSVSEAGGTATIVVQRVGGDDGAVSVQYATANGSAQAGSDYTATSGTLSWPDNDDNPRNFQVPISNDSTDEANETVQLSLSSPGGGAGLGSPAAATLTIQDDDAPAGTPGTLRLASASLAVSEGAGTATLSVVREGGSTGAVSVQYGTADGSAHAGADYVASSGTVSFANGDTAAKSIAVGLVNDGAEELAETFSVALSAPGGGATLGSPSAATVTIADDDFPTVCIADAQTLCLNNERFRVRVVWTDFQGGSGAGTAVPFTADSGFFSFFDPANLEILIKVLNACAPPFNRYWVYFAVASNVEYTIEVVDTQAGAAKIYHNPSGVYAPATGDNDAFATCP